ncbi:MAG TPA: hypothetical protein DCX25_01475 [Candidatus Pacebacteria bacterium]|nr:hypothetical protein [Candidatus Paceibacterota bacterium]HCR11608.1 hypothetical protein [Candidatus Paceibacterota bacterium]HCR93121.1 hypothetical protein [Candidatus Paceibacterota bacterium]
MSSISSNTMRIGIDARLAGPRHAGIGRYIEELLKHLFALKTQHEWVVFLGEKNQLPWLSSFPRVKQVLAPVCHYTLQEQLAMPKIFAREKLDLLHVPHFNAPLLYAGPYVVTIHDLLWHERRDPTATTLTPWMHAFKHKAYLFVAEMAMRRAKAVFVPTQFVKKVVARYVDAQRITVTPEGVADAYVHAPLVKESPFPYPYVLYVGSLYPHKNVPVIVRALASLPNMQFVVISGRSVFQESFFTLVKKMGVENRVHMLGYVPDTDAARIMQSAVALIQPSKSEGFGLSGVEAMAAGTPVIASDIDVFHEVYKDAAAYFNPDDASALAKQVRGLLVPAWRKTAIRRGKTIAKTYSWKTMADQTLSAYQKVRSSQ